MRDRSTRTHANSAAGRRNSAGFALIATIWTLGLMTLLATAAIVGARYRASEVSTHAATARISLAAESAVNLTIALLLQEPETLAAVAAKFPWRCRLPGGESAVITLEDERGKIDLNAAKPQSLALLFSRLSGSAEEGARIAERIVQFRQGAKRELATPAPTSNPAPPAASAAASANTPQLTADKAVNTPGAFLSILQLDQVASLSPALFRAVRPFVTIRSGRPDPSPAATSPQLRRLLNLPAPTAVSVPQGGGTPSFTIRVDVAERNGARFIREALVSFGGGTRPFTIHEWRRGDIDASSEPAHRMSMQMPRCLETGAI